jgi:hypothetical protein
MSNFLTWVLLSSMFFGLVSILTISLIRIIMFVKETSYYTKVISKESDKQLGYKE